MKLLFNASVISLDWRLMPRTMASGTTQETYFSRVLNGETRQSLLKFKFRIASWCLRQEIVIWSSVLNCLTDFPFHLHFNFSNPFLNQGRSTF